MIGNVWEWTSDWYRADHPGDNACGPELQDLAVTNGQSPSRVIKGGDRQTPLSCADQVGRALLTSGVSARPCLGPRCQAPRG